MHQSGERKSQSAVEFVSTYAFAFLILALAIFLLFALSSISTRTLPSQCMMYGGFRCVDAVYNAIGSSSQLTVLLTDTQPGVVSISAFYAKINNVAAVGTCTPNTLLSGNTVTCTAAFQLTASLGNSYTSTFNITANYCANGTGNVSNTACVAGNSFAYAGSLTAQAQ